MKQSQITIAHCYPAELTRSMYFHYLELYQARFLIRKPTHTWSHIFYWKKWMNYYADILIYSGQLSKDEHLANCKTVIDVQDGVKFDIDSRKKTIPDGYEKRIY